MIHRFTDGNIKGTEQRADKILPCLNQAMNEAGKKWERL